MASAICYYTPLGGPYLIVNANDISEYIYFADIVANYIEEQMNNTKTILENFHIWISRSYYGHNLS